METDIRLISATVLKEFHHEEIDGLDFSTIENSGEIEIVVELTRGGESRLVSRVVSDFDLFAEDMRSFSKKGG